MNTLVPSALSLALVCTLVANGASHRPRTSDPRAVDWAERAPEDAQGEIAPRPERAGEVADGAADFGVERAWLEEARALLERSDYVAARERTARAVDALLSRVEAEREDVWLGLLDAAGRAAFGAQDARTARRAWEPLLEARSRALPADHPQLQALRGNLAATRAALGDLAGARSLLEPVLESFSRTLPADHPQLQVARLSLAITIRDLGELGPARALLEQVVEVFSRTLPAGHPHLAMARGNLALTLHSLGDLQAARALLEQVLEALSRTLPPEHPDLQKARLNLAATIRDLGDPAGARGLYEEVLEAYTRTLPEDHPHLAMARANLAATVHALGEFQAARELYETAHEVLSRTLPADHPDLQAALGNLAATMYAAGDLAGARTRFEEVLGVTSQTLPADHPGLQRARWNLAATLAAQAVRSRSTGEGNGGADRERCVELLGELCRSQARAAREAVLLSSRREAEERSASLETSLGRALSYALGYGAFEPARELLEDVLVLSEATRGAALASAAVARGAAGSARYGELREALRDAGGTLADLARGGTTSATFQEAVSARDAIERELLELAKELAGGGTSGLELDATSLARALRDGRVAVAYRRFARWNVRLAEEGEGDDASAPIDGAVESLCAFVVRAPSVEGSGVGPVLVDLGPMRPIEDAVDAWRAALGVAAGRGLGLEPRAASDTLEQRGRELRALVFDPLLPALADARHVVLVLDDALHLVPFDALPIDVQGDGGTASGLLGQRLRLEARNSLGELLATRPDPPTGLLVALGAAAFDEPPAGLEPEGIPQEEPRSLLVRSPADTAPARTPGILRGSSSEGGFAHLAHTGPEVRELARMLPEPTTDASAVVLEGRRASRSALEALAPAARWLHVATHGWYAGESIRSWRDPEALDARSGRVWRMGGEEQVRGSSPMLLCGLALAGANLPEDAFGRAVGLLTAEELSTLDLSSCELAVLSACDTNVGVRRAGQGVASLQRALQMAGARSVITSLWKVPDEATAELMLDFYRRLWVEKKPKHQALWEAKMRLRDAKDERGQPLYTLRDWAAWVLTGDPD